MQESASRGTTRHGTTLGRRETWAIGVDGGGSGVRAWAAPLDHDPLTEPTGHASFADAANPYAIGVTAAAAAITRAITAAWHAAGADPARLEDAFVCVGTAGVERSEERHGVVAALIASGVTAERLTLLGDPWVALEGAIPEGPGARALLVAGTGSIAVSIGRDGRPTRVGGWGARVGDEGGGAWLGIEAVRATLRALDGRDPPGALAHAVQSAWGEGPESLVGHARDAAPSDFARLAPLVIAAADDDPVAAALRVRAVAALAELLTTAASATGDPVVASAVVGGVATALEGDLRGMLPPAFADGLHPPAGPPVAGAWRLARAAALRTI